MTAPIRLVPGDVAQAINNVAMECRPLSAPDMPNILAAFQEMVDKGVVYDTEHGPVQLTSVRLSDDGESIIGEGVRAWPLSITFTIALEPTS
jgi:hypothetical protein